MRTLKIGTCLGVTPLVVAALCAGLLSTDSLAFSFHKDKMAYPDAPLPNRDRLVAPPGENAYFPARPDGQPYILNVDSTVNLTRALNEFYYNPKWRGEVWTPFDQFDQIERATRLMGTYREYDEFSVLRVLNGVNKWFEKWSGYGP